MTEMICALVSFIQKLMTILLMINYYKNKIMNVKYLVKII